VAKRRRQARQHAERDATRGRDEQRAAQTDGLHQRACDQSLKQEAHERAACRDRERNRPTLASEGAPPPPFQAKIGEAEAAAELATSNLLQALIARPLMETIGLGGTLLVAAHEWSSRSACWRACRRRSPRSARCAAADLALGPSLFRSAYEPLFTPLPAATKRGTKALIDVVFDKGGDACASLLILLIALGGPLLVQRAPLLLSTFALRARRCCCRYARGRATCPSWKAACARVPCRTTRSRSKTQPRGSRSRRPRLGIDRDKCASNRAPRAENAVRADAGTALARRD